MRWSDLARLVAKLRERVYVCFVFFSKMAHQGHVVVETWSVDKHCIRGPSRRHLNSEKGDKFVFEQRPDRRTTKPGSLLGVIECGHVLAGRQALHVGTSRALTSATLLVLPYSIMNRLDNFAQMHERFLVWLMGAVAEQAGPFETEVHKATTVARINFLSS